MVDTFLAQQSIEQRKDLGDGDEAIFAYWTTQEKIAEHEERKFVKRGREIIKRYRDERPDSMQGTHRYNILWSNVQTLIPTLYGRTPAADVSRRFKDQADDSGRMAATLLETSIDYCVDMIDLDDVMESIVEDRLLPGRGVARVLYIPTFGEPIASNDNPEFEDTQAAPDVVDNPGDEADEKKADAVDGMNGAMQEETDPLREVVNEEAVIEYVFWEDYREGPARKWREVPWLRYRAYMTRDELVKRFGAKGKKVNLDYQPKGSPESVKEDPPPDIYKKAIVWEIWDKVKKQVVWLAPGTPDLILDQIDDPLRLKNFFPQPDPLRSTTTNDKRQPVADYIEYQDQAREMDNLTARIDRLTRALKVSGVYPGEEKQVLQQLVDEGTENRLIPVEDWPRWGDKGTLENLIQFMPIKQIAETLIQLYDAREKTKQTLYEITGIGDIMRGNTDPNETLGAQQLKANFSTRRITPQQKKVAKFASALFQIVGEVIALHFDPKTISKMTGHPQLQPVPQLPPMPPQMIPAPPQAQQPPQPGVQPQAAPGAPQQTPGGNVVPFSPQPAVIPNPAFAQWQQQQQQVQQIVAANAQLQAQFDAAVKLIKDDVKHGFRIDIEADSTIAADEQAEKQARTEFISEAVPLLGQLIPLAQGNPALADAAKELFLFGMRAFKAARPLEETFEKAFDEIGKMPPPPPKGGKGASGVDSPADIALRAKQIQADSADDQGKNQIAAQANAIKAQQVAGELQLGQQKLEAEVAHNSSKLSLDAQSAADEANFRRERGMAAEARTASGLT